jgi:hypothetical protein
METILGGLASIRRRANRISDEIKISRDRLNVIDVQRRFAGTTGSRDPGEIDLGPAEAAGDEDVFHNNRTDGPDQGIMQGDNSLDSEDIGLISGLPSARGGSRTNSAVTGPGQRPLWRRVARTLIPLRPPIVTNPKYTLPYETPSVETDYPLTPPPVGPSGNPQEEPAQEKPPPRQGEEPSGPSFGEYPVTQYQGPLVELSTVPIFLSGVTLASVLLYAIFLL